MSEKASYYTPEIEEFHVGFEYQSISAYSAAQGETLWKPSVVRLGTYTNLDGYAAIIANGNIRVKLLDQEDIESLGWSASRPEGNYFLMKGPGEGWRLLIRGKVIIYISKHGREECIYKGTCKNKSKLRMLMKDLNIK